MIMTQLPVQATPFGTNLNRNSGSNSSGNEGWRRVEGEPAGTSSASRKFNRIPFGMSNTSFVNLSGTDAVECRRSIPRRKRTPGFHHATATFAVDRQLQIRMLHRECYGMNPSISNNNNLNYLSTLNSATSNTYLNQLMSNAYAAQQQEGTARSLQRKQLLQQNQQQQPWRQSNPNPISSQGRGNNMPDEHHGHVIWSRGANGGNMGMGSAKQQQASLPWDLLWNLFG
jgi:hypothetical protein